jgi:hypothetical protein
MPIPHHGCSLLLILSSTTFASKLLPPVAALRAEFFNILNRPDFTSINENLVEGANPGLAAFTPDLGAFNAVLGSGGSRHIQLGAKFIR